MFCYGKWSLDPRVLARAPTKFSCNRADLGPIPIYRCAFPIALPIPYPLRKPYLTAIVLHYRYRPIPRTDTEHRAVEPSSRDTAILKASKL